MLHKPRIVATVLLAFELLIMEPWTRVGTETRHQPHALSTDHTRLARRLDEPFSLAPSLADGTKIRLEAPQPAAPLTSGTSSTESPSIIPDAVASVDLVSERRRREEVLAHIRYPWQKLGYEIVFLGPRPGYRAMTISDKRRIEIYSRPGDSPWLTAYDLAHELGHAFDLDRNTAERRSRWRELRGIDPATPWFGCNRCPDYNTPAGDFAETFAYLLLGPGNYHSRMALPPTALQIRELSSFCQINPRKTKAYRRNDARLQSVLVPRPQ